MVLHKYIYMLTSPSISSPTGLIDKRARTLIGQHLPPISAAGRAVSMIDRSDRLVRSHVESDISRDF